MAYKVFTDGSVLTASEVNDYLMRQAVVKCTSATRPASPDEWIVIGETDTDTKLYYNGSAWVILTEPRQTWTPTITQGGAGIAGTVNRGWYRRQNGNWEAALQWTSSGAGVAANAVGITLPLTMINTADVGGTFRFFDQNVPVYRIGKCVPSTTSAMQLQVDNTASAFGVTPAITIAANDVINLRCTGTY